MSTTADTPAASFLQDAATQSDFELLRALAVPDDACVAHIQEDLYALEAALTSIRTTSDDATSNLARTQLRADVECQQALSRAMFSPFWRLPLDILSLISMLVLPDDWGPLFPDLPKRTSLSSSQSARSPSTLRGHGT